MQTFPNIVQKFVDATGKILQPFMGYLQQFTIPPPPFVDIPTNLGTGDFEYQAEEPGFLYVLGPSSSAISLTRGRDTIVVEPNSTNPRLIVMAIKDTVTFTYTAGPIVKFIPSYGQNTTS